MDIRGIATGICKKYHTHSPFEIAYRRGVHVLYENLGNVRGYYSRTMRQSFIHINQSMSRHQQLFTCAHELGHSILHPNTNTPFLQASTLYSVDKLEVQANRFALEISYTDLDLQPFLDRPIDDAIAFMSVPLPLATYRMSTVQPTFCDLFE